MNVIEDTLRKKLEYNSKQNIKEYFNNLEVKDLVIYSIGFNCKNLLKSISELDDVQILDIYNFDDGSFIDFSHHCKYTKKKVTIVIIYFGYPMFLDSLVTHYENNCVIVDLMYDLSLSIFLTNNEFKHKLWYNIEKLVKVIPVNQAKDILGKSYSTYFQLFHELLNKAGYLNSNTLIFQYRSDFDYLLELVDNSLTFAGIKTSLNKENEKVFYGEELIRKFNNCCVLASPLYASRSKYGFLLEYSFIHEEFHIKANQHVKKNIFINKFIERFSTCIWFKIQAINVNRQSISLGYPKLDNFIKYYQTNKQKTSNIVFMASVYSDITLEYSATETDEFFLDDIVKKYYNQKVIYRPHPFSLSNTIVKGRIHRLNNYNNFYLDDSSSYFDVLSKNQVLISEGFGSSVYMYATATLKPVIFYLPNKDYLNRMEGFYGKNLTVIGDIAETRNELFSLINKHLNDIEYMKKKSRDIELFRNKNISNIGDSKNALIKFLNNYSHLVSKNKLTSFYQDKLVKLSKAKIKTYFDLIKNNKLIIYGAGEHFDNVLQKLYNFRNLNICFTDSNKELWGKEKDGINIISKLDIKSTDYIIISSKKYEQEIYNELRDQYSNIILLYENQEINNEIETIFADYYQIILFWFNIIKIEHFIDQDTLNDILNKDITSFKELSLQCLKASRINFNYTNSLELYFKKDSLYLMKNNYFPKNIE